jgi:glutathione synthase/RimK-type ligase-like ATP-grasp enzyme
MLGLVTAEVAAPLDPDLLPLDTAMRSRLGDGAVRIVSWDDRSVDWAAFSAVVIRSPWDYSDRLAEFLAWVDRVGPVTTLVNAPDVIRWSADKRYLADLAAEGVPVTPTLFVAPGQPAPSVEGLHVVKPTVGAGSNGARRCEPHEVAGHVAVLHAEGRTAMVQPYLDLLDERGETAHCFVVDDGRLALSHAFRKGAILTDTEVEREGDLFAKEEISARVPTAAELRIAEQALSTAVARGLGEIVFARVDIAPYRGGDGTESYVVLELELIEPSFYFVTDPSAVDRFADCFTAWLRHRGLVDPVPDEA